MAFTGIAAMRLNADNPVVEGCGGDTYLAAGLVFFCESFPSLYTPLQGRYIGYIIFQGQQAIKIYYVIRIAQFRE